MKPNMKNNIEQTLGLTLYVCHPFCSTPLQWLLSDDVIAYLIFFNARRKIKKLFGRNPGDVSEKSEKLGSCQNPGNKYSSL